VKAVRWILAWGLGLFLLGAVAVAQGRPPEGVAVFLSSAEGRLYALRLDPVAGWPVLFPVGAQAAGPVTGLSAGPDGALYACDPCGGKILRVTVPGLVVETVYDSHAQPACVCTEEVCDPYAGWLNPLDVTMADGALYFITAGKKCVLAGGESQGLWRIEPGDLEARPEEVLPGVLFAGPVPLSLEIVQSGPYSGRLLLTGLRPSHAAGAVSIAAPPDFSLPTVYAGDPGGEPTRLRLLADGDVLWLDPGGDALRRVDAATGAVSEFLLSDAKDAVAFTCDAEGRVYALIDDGSHARVVIVDASGRFLYQQGLTFVPEAIGVLELP